MYCLRCGIEALVPGKGALGEAVCLACRGRLLDDQQAQVVLQQHCGLERSLLAEMANHYQGRGQCPSCHRRMALLPVRGVEVDLCLGCGSLHLDAGELSRLTSGAVAELPGADTLAAEPTLEAFGPAGVDVGGPPVDDDPMAPGGGFSREDRSLLEEAFGAPAAGGTALPGRTDGLGMPTPIAVLGHSAVPLEQRAIGTGPCAVFLTSPPPAPDVEVLVRAWQAAGFRTGMDARAFRQRVIGGVAVDDCPAEQALVIADTLRAAGWAAVALPVDEVTVPPAVRTKEVVVSGPTLQIADSLGRLQPVAATSLLAVFACRTRVVTTMTSKPPQRGPGLLDRVASAGATAVPGGRMMKRVADGVRRANAGPSGQLTEVDETLVDLVFADQRIRVDESGLIRRADGPRSLQELLQQVAPVSPKSCLWTEGARALHQGERVRQLRSSKEIDREISWALWRRHV